MQRQVYRCRKSAAGDVLALVSTTAAWSPRTSTDAIADIESGRFRYVVDWGGGPIPVTVTRGRGGSCLDAVGPDGRTGGLLALPHG